ncbi:hypothetical protein OPV22_005626 [Ensete ventricosum]|uniref:Uncharacterized protein n=1 Tax=Ensete ventricosum TaxID=4639 RepID=A0AAV8RPL4_ENSVE|nr:hypothetical protein OPV22_005626 [Ensete ventricosum]
MREELDGLRLAIDGYLLTLPSLNGLLNHPLELEQIELGEHGDMVKPEGHRKLNSLPNHGRHVGSNSSLTSFVITALSSSHINGLNPEATRPSYVWVSNFDGLNTPRFGLPTEASLAFESSLCHSLALALATARMLFARSRTPSVDDLHSRVRQLLSLFSLLVCSCAPHPTPPRLRCHTNNARSHVRCTVLFIDNIHHPTSIALPAGRICNGYCLGKR